MRTKGSIGCGRVNWSHLRCVKIPGLHQMWGLTGHTRCVRVPGLNWDCLKLAECGGCPGCVVCSTANIGICWVFGESCLCFSLTYITSRYAHTHTRSVITVSMQSVHSKQQNITKYEQLATSMDMYLYVHNWLMLRIYTLVRVTFVLYASSFHSLTTHTQLQASTQVHKQNLYTSHKYRCTQSNTLWV